MITLRRILRAFVLVAGAHCKKYSKPFLGSLSIVLAALVIAGAFASIGLFVFALSCGEVTR